MRKKSNTRRFEMAFMKRLAFLLVSISVILAMLNISSLATAGCSTCGGTEEDWGTSAANFLEGKPVDETTPLWGPQAARQKNSKMNSESETGDTKKALDSGSIKKGGESEASVLDIMLREIHAMPNPAAPNSPVMITAVFARDGSQNPKNQTAIGNQTFEDILPGIDQAAILVLATIKDSAGTEAGNVTLQHTFGNEYAGIWNASSTPGIYKANLKATASGATKTFGEALQIEVAVTTNTVGNNASSA
jgi:hypothetical protein